MKLGVITTSYPRFPGDPAGSFVAGHVEAMRALGHTVEVIAAGGERARVDADGVHRVGGGGLFYRGGAPDALERDPLAAGLAAAAVTARLVAAVARRAHRWDAMFAHWLVPSAIAALPSTAPLVAIAHGGDVFTLRRLRLLRPVLTALRLRRARLVFVGEHLRAIARDAAPALAPWLDRAIVQPMGLALAPFTALAEARRRDRDRDPTAPRPIILVVARLVPVKGVDVVLAAMPRLRTAAELVIAGDGPERARLQAGSPHRWLGEVSTAVRDDLLRRAAVVVVPSRVLRDGRTEGTPMIALEALAAGVPVVASDVGGLRDLPGVRLVPPEDPDLLARAIDLSLDHSFAPGPQSLGDPRAPELLYAATAALDWCAVAPRLLALIRE